jgi:hypothetical protein
MILECRSRWFDPVVPAAQGHDKRFLLAHGKGTSRHVFTSPSFFLAPFRADESMLRDCHHGHREYLYGFRNVCRIYSGLLYATLINNIHNPSWATHIELDHQ